MVLRIAAVQAEARTDTVSYNISKALDFIRRAAAKKVNVIVFPEAFVTGYDDAGAGHHADAGRPTVPMILF